MFNMRLKVPNIALLEGAGIIMEMMEIDFVDRPGEKLWDGHVEYLSNV